MPKYGGGLTEGGARFEFEEGLNEAVISGQMTQEEATAEWNKYYGHLVKPEKPKGALGQIKEGVGELSGVSMNDANFGKIGSAFIFNYKHEDLLNVSNAIKTYVEQPWSETTSAVLFENLKTFEADWDFINDKNEGEILKFLLTGDGHIELRGALKIAIPNVYKSHSLNNDGTWAPVKEKLTEGVDPQETMYETLPDSSYTAGLTNGVKPTGPLAPESGEAISADPQKILKDIGLI